MKKLTLTLTAITLSLSSFCQLKIVKNIDEMTDEITYMANKRFIAANESLNKGCAIDMIIAEKDGRLGAKHLITTMVGLDKCNENNTLIILFDNSDKITLESWNKFNCKGDTYFTFTDSHIQKLKTQTIDKVRITNGSSYKSYTAQIKEKDYFIKFYKLLN